jgi:hypothetical protein
VPDNHTRPYIRCQFCDRNVPLDDDNELDVRPGPKKKRRRKQLIRFHSGMLVYLPLLVILPLLTCPCLAYAHPAGGPLGVITGLIVMAVAIARIFIFISGEGLTWWDDWPWYLRGGAALVYKQIQFALMYPKEVGIWLILEVLGLVVAIASGVMAEAGIDGP